MAASMTNEDLNGRAEGVAFLDSAQSHNFTQLGQAGILEDFEDIEHGDLKGSVQDFYRQLRAQLEQGDAFGERNQGIRKVIFGTYKQETLTEERQKAAEAAHLKLTFLMCALEKKISGSQKEISNLERESKKKGQASEDKNLLQQEKLEALAKKKSLEAFLKNLSSIKALLPAEVSESAYNKKFWARISKILNTAPFVAFAVFSSVCHFAGYGVHLLFNQQWKLVPTAVPTQGLTQVFNPMLVNNTFGSLKQLRAAFGKSTRFKRITHALKMMAAVTYVASAYYMLQCIASGGKFLALYNQAISTLSPAVGAQALAMSKTMLALAQYGIALGAIASSVMTFVSLMKWTRTMYLAFRKGDPVEKEKILKRSVSLAGNALMTVGFFLMAVNPLLGVALVGAGALILIGLKIAQLYLARQARKKELQALKDKVVEKGVNPAAPASTATVMREVSVDALGERPQQPADGVINVTVAQNERF